MGGANFIGLSGGGNHVMLVIDTSSSMPRICGADGIKAIRKEYERTIKALKSSMKFNIICYADQADALFEKSLPATGENKQTALKFFEDYFTNAFAKTRTQTYGKRGKDNSGIAYVPIPPDSIPSLKNTVGGSRVDLGLVAAMEHKPSTIFVLSDGEPSTRQENKVLTDTQIIKLIDKEYQRIYGSGKLEVNTISIKGNGANFMKKIASHFKGKYKDIKPDKL
jgi:hypothetical protein